ncbi:MAG TPA: ABC transporter permease [Thermoanaerobaculia bacterium]|jgi:hypothetical protein|nr:ABC transporter permease [Thermoanaerobaculia bacterium]
MPRPFAAASCFLLAFFAVACENALSKLQGREEEVAWKRNVLATELKIHGAGQPEVARLHSFLDRAVATPGVVQAAVVDQLPGIPLPKRRNQSGLQLEGNPQGTSTFTYVVGVSSGYFATMEIQLIRGRLFSERDDSSSIPVAIVSESFAKENWPGEDPLGKRLRLHGTEPWSTVVGVVRDEPVTEDKPQVYLPYGQHGLHDQHLYPFSWFLLARAAVEPKSVASALQRTVGTEFWSLGTWLKSRYQE